MTDILWLISLVIWTRRETAQESLILLQRDFHVWATAEIHRSHLTKCQHIELLCMCDTGLRAHIRGLDTAERVTNLKPEPHQGPLVSGEMVASACMKAAWVQRPEHGGPLLLSCANRELKGVGSCKPDRPSDLSPPIPVPTQQASTGVPLAVAAWAKLLEFWGSKPYPEGPLWATPEVWQSFTAWGLITLPLLLMLRLVLRLVTRFDLVQILYFFFPY